MFGFISLWIWLIVVVILLPIGAWIIVSLLEATLGGGLDLLDQYCRISEFKRWHVAAMIVLSPGVFLVSIVDVLVHLLFLALLACVYAAAWFFRELTNIPAIVLRTPKVVVRWLNESLD